MAKTPAEKLKEYSIMVQKVPPEKFDFLLDEIPKMIRVRTRLGKGIDGILKPLSKWYIMQRKGIIAFRKNKSTGGTFVLEAETQAYIEQGRQNKKSTSIKIKHKLKRSWDMVPLSSETKPDKSNLTYTGQMLNSIIGIRQGYKLIFSFSNKESDKKAFYARENGRPFFGLSASQKNGLQRSIGNVIKEELRKMFKS